MKMKPIEKEIKDLMDECEKRYADQDIDTRKIATVLNVMKLLGDILDRQNEAIIHLADMLEEPMHEDYAIKKTILDILNLELKR